MGVASPNRINLEKIHGDRFSDILTKIKVSKRHWRSDSEQIKCRKRQGDRDSEQIENAEKTWGGDSEQNKLYRMAGWQGFAIPNRLNRRKTHGGRDFKQLNMQKKVWGRDSKNNKLQKYTLGSRIRTDRNAGKYTGVAIPNR